MAGASSSSIELGVLDHHHRIGAARHDAAGRDRRRGAGRDFDGGFDAASDDFGIELKPLRGTVAGAGRIGGAHRETVDIGAVERRRIDRRDHVGREHAGERRGKRQGFAAERRTIDAGLETPARLRGRDHFEELLLPRGAPHRLEDRRAAVESCLGLMAMA